MKKEIDTLKKEAFDKIGGLTSLSYLDEVKVEFLGRKQGKLTLLMKKIPGLKAEEKRKFGPLLNELKKEITTAIENKYQELSLRNKSQAGEDFFDITLPGIKIRNGSLHPITQERIKVEEIFQKMGFDIVSPREVDDDYHVFESLNLPKDHPAREMWDTFWTENGFIPITHTSSMQNRMLQEKEPPFGAICPGRCFRNESTDARHEHTFYQVEGLYIGEGIHLGHLIGTILTFLEEYFGKKLKYKIQPSYFPFVEPGLEFLVPCVICDGKGFKEKEKCSTCSGSGWLELIPCGMTHRKVIEMGGLDPNKYSGFAWGMGLDRLVMLKYGIEDIRHFHSGNLKFIRQF